MLGPSCCPLALAPRVRNENRSMWQFHSFESFDGHGHICGHCIRLLVESVMVLYNTSSLYNFVFIFLCHPQIRLNCFSDRQAGYDRSQGERDIYKDKIELHREESVRSDYGFLESRKFTMFFVILTSGFFFFCFCFLCRLMKFMGPLQAVNSISIVLFAGIKMI